MITSYDRSYWFGASDTRHVMASNHSTKTWLAWWEQKCGVGDGAFTGNVYTRMGTVFEHPILDAIDPNINKDRQLKVPLYNLRVNYDGDLDGVIYEVKTHRGDKEIDTMRGSQYWKQCQVEMFAWQMYYKACANHKDWHIRQHLAREQGVSDIVALKECCIVEYPLMPDEYNRIDAYENGTEKVVIDSDRIRLHKIKYDRGFISEYKEKLRTLAHKIQRGDYAPW